MLLVYSANGGLPLTALILKLRSIATIFHYNYRKHLTTDASDGALSSFVSGLITSASSLR